MEGLKKIGLKPIKQVKLWSKWGPLIQDEEERNSLCPKSTDEIISKVKGNKTKKSAVKKAAAKALLEGTSATASTVTLYVPPDKPMAKWLKKENKAWLKHKGLLTSGNVKELKARVKDYVDNIATLAVVPVSTEKGSDALSIPLVIEDAEASVHTKNV